MQIETQIEGSSKWNQSDEHIEVKNFLLNRFFYEQKEIITLRLLTNSRDNPLKISTAD
jgi:hypothetical protein